MENARNISRYVDEELFESYSHGLLVPHLRPESDHDYGADYGPTFRSNPDVEAIIASVNNVQTPEVLMDQLGSILSEPRTYQGRNVTISGIKFSFPHRTNSHNIPPPHPSMSDEEIMAYIWPNTSLNRRQANYTAKVWVDIGVDNIDFAPSGDAFTFSSRRVSDYVSILDWPVMVGSNLCNLAILRHYLDVPEYRERTQYLLNEVIKYDPDIPDGHFIVNGRLKRVAVLDRIIMNNIYVIASTQSFPSPFDGINEAGDPASSATITPVGNRIIEIRSVREGITLHKMMIAYGGSRPRRGHDPRVHQLYNGIVVMTAPALSIPMNVLNIIRVYAHLVTGTDGVAKFREYLETLSNGDPEVMRYFTITNDDASTSSVDHLVNMMRMMVMKRTNTSVHGGEDDLADRMTRIIMPHCNYSDDEEANFDARLRVMAMMFIELVATLIPNTSIGPIEPTERKDFSYKRWEAPGQQMKDYLRTYITAISRLDTVQSSRNNMITMMKQNKWATKYVKYNRESRNKDAYLDGVVDDLADYNIASMLDSIRTVKIDTKAHGGSVAVRRIHTSQWGAQCIANTPENNNIGLINNLAEAVLISDDLTSDEMATFEDVLASILDGPNAFGEHHLIVDGVPRGTVDEDVYHELREARKNGHINRGIGLAMHLMWNRVPVIVVRTSHGRPIIPMFRIDKDDAMVDRLLDPDSDIYDMSMDEMLTSGIVELVDSYELSWSCVVAEWLYVRERGGSFVPIDGSKYTHAMIKPGYILSQVSNTLSFIEHNPAARGTYATVHVKQSIGRPFKYEKDRYDNDTNYLMNPEPSILMTDTARRIGMDKVGIGRNVRIACMSYDSNRDDAVLFSDRLVESGALDGYHYNVFRSERGVLDNRYNWIIQELPSGDHVELRGLIDPNFSDSIILPYGDPHIVEVMDLPDPVDGLYELEPGMLYRMWGTYRSVTVTYDDGTTREVVPGTETIAIPGKTYSITGRGPITYRMALAYVSTEWRDRIITGRYDGFDLGWHTTPFISEDATDGWHGPVEGKIPRTLNGTVDGTTRGQLLVLYPRRKIVRGDVAIRVVERDMDGITGTHTERFDITYGYIDGIDIGDTIRIKGAMPIGPKPGNKYAALYAQKNINAGIIPRDKMPKARWYNPVTDQDEEMEFDIVFNPLSFPSRMTMGMILEIFIAGTIDYIYSRPYGDGTLHALYQDDPDQFDDYMYNEYGIENAYALIEDLTNTTAFMYDNMEKVKITRDLRSKLGLPADGNYDMWIGDEKIENKIFCGTVYYVSLRHLVDNKRRARGYVGRKNPVTYQPVKGRRTDGGAKTGLQEKDAYAAHGASALLHERMAMTSDAITLYKCSRCGGLATEVRRRLEFRCLECDTILGPEDVIRHHTVWSYQLLTYYLRSIGVNLIEEFK